MKALLGTLTIVVAIFGSPKESAAQQDQPFCLRESDGNLTCHFETMAQCEEAMKKGPTRTGSCIPNPKTKN